MFVILKSFDERHGDELRDTAIAEGLRQKLFQQIEDAQVAVFGAPPVDGLGNAGGFKLMIEDRGDNNLQALQEQTENLADKGNQTPGLVDLFTMFRANTPQQFLAVDRTKCKTMGVALNDVFDALQVYLGGYYINDFNQFGRTWQVNCQADARFRMHPQDVKQLKVAQRRRRHGAAGHAGDHPRFAAARSSSTATIPIPPRRSTATGRRTMSSGQAIAAMQRLADRELPPSMAYEWTELSLLQILAGNTALYIFPLCVLMMFLVLAAQYESWSLPLAIILIVPMCLLFAPLGVWLRGLDNNLFTQIGLVVLMGLACKNAILIVEFAKQLQEHGSRP